MSAVYTLLVAVGTLLVVGALLSLATARQKKARMMADYMRRREAARRREEWALTIQGTAEYQSLADKEGDA